MRGTNLIVATMALSALVLIGVTSTGSTTATFTAATTNPDNTFQTATLLISNDKPNAGDLVNITNLVPGDTAQRVVHITNGGNTGFTYADAETTGYSLQLAQMFTEQIGRPITNTLGYAGAPIGEAFVDKGWPAQVEEV